MKKMKNKFILGVIWFIICIVVSQVFIAYSYRSIDTNSYLVLLKGKGVLNKVQLEKDKKTTLHSGDIIQVIWKSSLAVIEWWDGSLTRLWGNTKIKIDQNKISRDYTDINISFELIAWKTWSNIVSFIWKDSSFTQSFNGMEAWVRGTVFDVDLTNDFLHVSDHQVALKDAEWKTTIIEEWKSLQLSQFLLLDVQEFINNFQDNTWVDLNNAFDTEYLGILKNKLESTKDSKNPFLFIMEWFSPKYRILYELDTSDNYASIEELIMDISETKKEKVYTAVLSKYQSMNFIQATDYVFYKRKMFYKKALISLSDNTEVKEQLIRSTVYDLQDIIKSENLEWMKETLWVLLENKNIIDNIDVSFIEDSFEFIPEDLREEFQESFEDIKGIFNFDISFDTIKNIDKDSIVQGAKDGLDSIDEGIQNILNDKVGWILDSIIQKK